MYKLNSVFQDLCPLHMQSVIIVQQPLSTPTMKHVTIGEVRIKQSVPLPCIKNEIDSTYNTSVIKNLQDIDSYKVSHIVTSYSLRNSKCISILMMAKVEAVKNKRDSTITSFQIQKIGL